MNYIKFKNILNRLLSLVENAVTPEYINLKLNIARKRNVITIGGIRPQKDPKNFAKIVMEILKKDKTISFT